MILSGRDIELYLGTGRLKIDPVTPIQFQQNGIDLILDSIKEAETNFGHDKFAPGRFYLGCTREYLELPDDLMAFVELRSSWARRALIIPPTIVDAGFKGNLTLEVVSFGHLEFPVGQRFAHLIFAKTTGPCVPYQGKYINQTGITGARPDES